MNELRRLLAGGDDTAAPADLNADERFLLDRFAMVAALLLDAGERYPALWESHNEHGPSPETEAAALEAAGNIGLVMQTLRRREDLTHAMHESPLDPVYATGALDQIFFSLTLLTGAEESEAALTPDELAELLELPKLKDWLEHVGVSDAWS